MLEQKAKEIEAFWGTLDPQFINEQNIAEAKRAANDFENFKKAFNKNICSLCGKPLKTFSTTEPPCLHWLLRPKKVKKQHIKKVLEHFGYERTEAYVRWVANIEKPFLNINDLKEEQNPKALFQHSVVYKHIKWSFSCVPSDLAGHSGKQPPHFHFQMSLDERPFFKFSDFHAPFNDHDLFMLALKYKTNIPKKFIAGPGAGLQALTDEETLASLVKNGLKASANEDDADFHMNTLLVASEGGSIDGEEVHAAILRAQEKGVPVAAELGEIEGHMTTILEKNIPHVEISKRSETKRSGMKTEKTT